LLLKYICNETFREMKDGESPSANGACSARGLARVCAVVVNGGELDDFRLMSKEGVDALEANVKTAKDHLFMGTGTDFSQGGVCFYK